MGAIMAVEYALGYDADKMVAVTCDVMRRCFRGELTIPVVAFLKGHRLHRVILAALDNAHVDMEDLWLPCFCVSANLTRSRMHVHSRGSVLTSILASSRAPGMYPPIVLNGDLLVDGGVVNNVPISRALAAGCTRIFVLLCGPLHYQPRPAKRPAEAALTAFFVAIHARFVRELTAIPPGVEVVVFSGGGEPSAQYRDFSGTATMIEEGRAEVAEVLDRYAGTSQDVTVPQEAGR